MWVHFKSDCTMCVICSVPPSQLPKTKKCVLIKKKSIAQAFQSGDSVLVLLSISDSALQVKFADLYLVDWQLSEMEYVIQTPDHGKRTHVGHINVLKKYVGREDCADPSPVVVPVVSMSVIQPPTQCCGWWAEDFEWFRCLPWTSIRLCQVRYLWSHPRISKSLWWHSHPNYCNQTLYWGGKSQTS